MTKNLQGQDEIVVQGEMACLRGRGFLFVVVADACNLKFAGDVSDDVLEMIEDGVGVLKGVPADRVKLVEEKKKKAGEAEAE